jgi:hypothetical protein
VNRPRPLAQDLLWCLRLAFRAGAPSPALRAESASRPHRSLQTGSAVTRRSERWPWVGKPPGRARAAHGPIGSGAPEPTRRYPDGAGHAGHRPPLLSRRHDPGCSGLNRNAPRWCGGRFKRWTRTQRIRTAAAISIDAVIFDAAQLPVYQRIAAKAQHLRELGMSAKAIARALGVSDKTVAQAFGLLPGSLVDSAQVRNGRSTSR